MKRKIIFLQYQTLKVSHSPMKLQSQGIFCSCSFYNILMLMYLLINCMILICCFSNFSFAKELLLRWLVEEAILMFKSIPFSLKNLHINTKTVIDKLLQVDICHDLYWILADMCSYFPCGNYPLLWAGCVDYQIWDSSCVL